MTVPVWMAQWTRTHTIGAVFTAGAAIALSCALFASKSGPPLPVSEELTTAVGDLENDLQSLKGQVAHLETETTKVEALRVERTAEKARLSGRAEARTAELKRLESSRDVKASVAQQQVQETRSKTIQEAEQALKTQVQLQEDAALQAQLEKTLTTSRFNVVHIVSMDQNTTLGTGFFMNEDASSHVPWVITTQAVVPTDGLTLIKINVLAGRSLERIMLLRAQASYRDTETGLVFLRLLASPSVSVHSYTPRSFGEAPLGERVYAIGMQGVAGALQDNSVMEGNVSALEREVDGRKYLQLNLPANTGSSGATVINRKGQLVGVLVGAVEGLERTSVAIPASKLKDALERFINRAPVGTVQQPAAHAPQAADPSALKGKLAGPAPYDETKVIPCPQVRTPAYYPWRSVFAGPDDLLILYDDNHPATFAAYSLKAPAKPVWTLKCQPNESLWLLPVDSSGNAILLSSLQQTGTFSQFDLRTGVASRTCKMTDKGVYDPPSPTYAVLSFSDWTILYGYTCSVFDLTQRRTHFWPNPGAKPLVRDGSDIWLAREAPNERNATDLVSIPAAQIITFLRQLAALEKLDPADPKTSQLENDLKGYFDKAGRLMAKLPPLVASRGLSTIMRIPGSRALVWGDQVVDLTRNPPLVRRIETPVHSKQNEASFQSYLRIITNEKHSLNHPLEASADGQWLLLPGHLVNARTLKTAAELPAICWLAGFMADSKTIYFVDYDRKQVGFWDVDELIKKFPVKAAGQP